MNRQLALFILFFVLASASASVFAVNSCDPSLTILRLGTPDGSNAGTWDGSSYLTQVCYSDLFNQAAPQGPHACGSSNQVLQLSAVSSAHSAAPNVAFSSTAVSVCYGNLQCAAVTGGQDCASGSTCVVKLSALTNAHTALCSSSVNYPVKVCCTAGQAAAVPGPGEVCTIKQSCSDGQSCLVTSGKQGLCPTTVGKSCATPGLQCGFARNSAGVTILAYCGSDHICGGADATCNEIIPRGSLNKAAGCASGVCVDAKSCAGSPLAGDTNKDGKIDNGEVAGDINNDGKIDGTEIAGDLNGDGKIDNGEVAGDVNGDGKIDDNEVAGDVNGDKKIDSGEVAGDINGDKKIDNSEVAGDTNGDGSVTSADQPAGTQSSGTPVSCPDGIEPSQTDLDSDGVGGGTSCDFCPGTESGAQVDQYGCAFGQTPLVLQTSSGDLLDSCSGVQGIICNPDESCSAGQKVYAVGQEGCCAPDGVTQPTCSKQVSNPLQGGMLTISYGACDDPAGNGEGIRTILIDGSAGTPEQYQSLGLPETGKEPCTKMPKKQRSLPFFTPFTLFLNVSLLVVFYYSRKRKL